jgi:DNA-binding beta-propeller fold protein YncE
MKYSRIIYLIIVIGISISISTNAQSIYKPYSSYKEIPATGDGGWDYISVDAKGRRCYASHGEKVEVFNVDNDTWIGEIGNQHGVHGIAIAIPENKGFISNGKTNDVTVFDLRNNQVLAQIASTGMGVDAITYNTFMHSVIVHNSKSHSITIIDAKTNQIKGTVDSLGKTEFGVSDDLGFYYINLENEGKVVKIDLKKLIVVDRWSLSPDNTPAGMAIDIKNHRLFSGARTNNLVIIDTETGKIVTSVPIGDHNDAVVYDPETKLIYVSSILADLTIIKQNSADQYEVVQHVKTKLFSKTMALDTKTKKIYLPSASLDGTDEKKSKILPGTVQILVYKN